MRAAIAEIERGQIEKVGEQIFFAANRGPRLCLCNRPRRDVDPDDVVPACRQGADIVTRAATGNDNLAGERAILREKIEQGGMRPALFPRRFAAAIKLVPIGLRLIHECG